MKSIPVGLLVALVPLGYGTADAELFICSPEQRPTPLQELSALQDSESIDRLLALRVQQLRLRPGLTITVFFQMFLFRSLLALYISGSRKVNINDLINFCVLERLEQLSNLMKSTWVIRLFLDLDQPD